MVCAQNMAVYDNNPRFVRNFWEESFSEVIDVRSPGEFAQDHIPGAVNLPVLGDSQRAEIGSIYAGISHFEAKKRGSSYITGNISAYLGGHFAGKDKSYRPLIYCWRGGLRSHSMATVLSQVGWRVTVIEGGYRTYRARVRELIEHVPAGLSMIVLCGLTGSGKTALLRLLQEAGSQVLDLEDLARHRGSIMGNLWSGLPVAQPQQKMFESYLAEKLFSFSPLRPVWVESESNRIGILHLPLSLWARMRGAVTVELHIPMEARARLLLEEYSHFLDNPEPLRENLRALMPLCGRKRVERWLDLTDSGELLTVAMELLECHYDPSYRRSMSKSFRPPCRVIEAAGLSQREQEGLAMRLRELETEVVKINGAVQNLEGIR